MVVYTHVIWLSMSQRKAQGRKQKEGEKDRKTHGRRRTTAAENERQERLRLGKNQEERETVS